MPVTKTEKRGSVTVYTVDKRMDDAHAVNLGNKFVSPSMIDFIIRDDADVYTTEGKLLLRFRKSALSEEHAEQFGV